MISILRSTNRSERITPTKFATIYVVWSILWVVGSDYVMQVMVQGPSVVWEIQFYEGCIYVLVSGFILFFALRERDRKYKADHAASESILRSLRQSGLVGIYQWNSDGRITDANGMFLNALGYTEEELRSGKLNLKAMTPQEYWEADRIAAQQVSERGHCALYEKQAICKDGSRLDVMVGRSLIEGFIDREIGYVLDITELKQSQAEKLKLEKLMAQKEKLNALGELAGGIVHDFNNLLSVIIGYSSLTESRFAPDDPFREHTVQVLRAADKAKNLTRKLLAFSSKQVLNFELVNVNELILELHGILSRVLDERIELKLQLGQNISNIEADPSQIEQVLLNLVFNARDAMPSGGTLTIETSNVLSPWPNSAPDQLKGGFVVLRVSDTGIGMAPEVQARIFEPFFTTKENSGGTGLGLATVYGIVRQSRGHVEVESTVGSGSTFAIYFPHSRTLQFPSRKTVPDAFPVKTGSETILLVEDLDELREMLAVTLRSKGYGVIQARNGEEAVQVARSFTGEIQLVVSDVVMPRMNGPEAFRRISEDRPNLKAIFITGYAENALEIKSVDPSAITVEKPVRPEMLLEKIREVLDLGHAPGMQSGAR
jgi:two-component system, cell cycle sensor histidine kinase and response regulator CckA